MPSDPSILDLLEELHDLELEAIRLREKPACTVCREGDPCWFCKPWVPATVISGATAVTTRTAGCAN